MQRTLTALALACALGACHKAEEAPPTPVAPEKKGPPEVAENEPNNDTKSAQVLTAPARVKASFAAGGKDDDWFRLDSPQPVVARAQVDSGAGNEVVLEVYDQDRNRILKTSGLDTDEVAIPSVTCAGSCWFKVSPAKKDATGDYAFTLTFAPPTPRSEKEPNNRYVDAQPVQVGSAIDAFLAPADDEDWYLLQTAGMTPDQVFQISLASPPDVRLELVVARQSDQAPLATYRAPDVGQDLKLRDLAIPAAPEAGYYLVVRSAYVSQPGKKATRLADAKVAYTLEVKAAAGAPDLEVEPNEDAVHATPMDTAQAAAAPAPAAAPNAGSEAAAPAAPAAPAGPVTYTRTGYLAPKGDSDWFTFKTTGPSIVRAEVSGVDRVNLVLAIIDPEKKNDEKDNELAKSDQGDVKEPETLAGIAVPAGDNYLRIDGAWKKVDDRYVRDYENPNEPYTLTVTVAPDDGTWEREPNDKPEKATPVEVGRSYSGFIQPARDVDNWRLEVKEASNVAITVSAVPKLDLVLTVKDLGRDGAIVGQVDKNKVEAEERLVVPFEPGSYVIEVKEKGKESNAQRPYTLTLK